MIPTTFAGRLAYEREKLHLSPAALSRQLGGSPSTTSIQTLERNEVLDPVVSTIQRLADAFGMRASVLAKPLIAGVRLAHPSDWERVISNLDEDRQRSPLGSFLFQARTKVGMALRDVEYLTGGQVKHSTVAALESGIRLSPRVLTAQHLCLVYGADFDTLARLTAPATKELTTELLVAN